MKKFIYLLLLIFPCFVSAATCEAADKAALLTLSSVIEVNYEEMDGYYTGEEVGYPEGLAEEDYDDYKLEYNYFNINILNITEDFYIVITNNINDTELTINYSDSEDGIYTFLHETLSNVTTYTINVYSSGENGCSGELLAVKYLVVPKYNEYSTWDMCEDYSDEAVCQKYTTVETYNESFVFNALSLAYSERFNVDIDDDIDVESIIDVVLDNFVYILIGGIGVIGIVVLIIFINKKRSDLK